MKAIPFLGWLRYRVKNLTFIIMLKVDASPMAVRKLHTPGIRKKFESTTHGFWGVVFHLNKTLIHFSITNGA